MNNMQVREFLHSKNWYDFDNDFRFVNTKHPYAIILSEDEVKITLRENYDHDNGQNGEQIFSLPSLGELKEWYENNIGE